VGFHSVDEPLGSAEQFKDGLAVQPFLAVHAKQSLGIVAEKRLALSRALFMDETAIVLHEEAAGPVVAASSGRSGYLHDLLRKRNDVLGGRIAHQFTSTERHKILKLDDAFRQKSRVFHMEGRAALAAAGTALAAVMYLTHNFLKISERLSA
jgi:hypothetical protein